MLINNVSKRRIFFKNFREFENKRKELASLGESNSTSSFAGLPSSFWSFYKEEKEKDSNTFINYLKPSIKQYFGMRSPMKNISLNYPCQGTAAEMSKLACIMFYNYLVDKNLLFIVKIVNIVHDEIVVECPEEMSEEISKKLIKCMEKAGDIFSDIKMTADYEIGKSWEH